jgi:hypothetical protein
MEVLMKILQMALLGGLMLSVGCFHDLVDLPPTRDEVMYYWGDTEAPLVAQPIEERILIPLDEVWNRLSSEIAQIKGPQRSAARNAFGPPVVNALRVRCGEWEITSIDPAFNDKDPFALVVREEDEDEKDKCYKDGRYYLLGEHDENTFYARRKIDDPKARRPRYQEYRIRYQCAQFVSITRSRVRSKSTK